jgi:predicted RND superfamily exporter protein
MLWTQAVLVLGRWQLSMVSSTLAAIVTVVGVAAVMHVVVRFRELRGQGLPPPQALAAAGTIVAVPLLWACLTDAGGFGALLSGSVGPIRDFGLMMALGSLLVPVSIALLLPGLALLGRFDADPRRVWGEDRLDIGLEGLLRVILRRPWTSAVLSFAAAGLLSSGVYRMQVETDFTRNFRQDSPVVTSYEFVESRLGGAGVWDVILPAPAELDLPYLRRVRKLEQRLRSEVLVDDETGRRVPGLTKVLGLCDILDAGPIDLEQLPALVREQSLRLATGQIDVQLPVIARALRGEDPQQPGRHYFRIMLRARERQPSQAKLEIISAVRQISREEFPEAQVTGFFVLLTNLIDSLLRDQWLTFGVATAVILPMLVVALRSVRLALVAFVPNVLPILMVMGLIGWLGLRINMGAAMIAAVSIGLSVDSSLHYLAEFQRQREQGLSLDEALHRSHQSVGRAAVFSTLALVVGFSALVQSQFVPTIYFGALMSLAMLGGLIGNLIMLPLLLALVMRERQA